MAQELTCPECGADLIGRPRMCSEHGAPRLTTEQIETVRSLVKDVLNGDGLRPDAFDKAEQLMEPLGLQFAQRVI